jgi:SAM-dependent methyltransferase
MIDWAHRQHTPEQMDGPCDYETFRGCLVDLARVNAWTLAYRPTLAFVKRFRGSDALSILDVGSGYGDMLRTIAAWAVRNGHAVKLTGVDLNPYSARAAEAATPSPPSGGEGRGEGKGAVTEPTTPPPPAARRPLPLTEEGESQTITYVTANAFDYTAESGVDLIVSSLFTHHLQDAEIVQFLRWMEATARRGWFVNDLHRHPLPYHVFRLWLRLARWHPFVQSDGPISITRAFTRADWRKLLAEAGLADVARVSWWFPFRYTVGRVK